MEFGILGPLEVRDGAGGLVRVPGAKERALLADLTGSEADDLIRLLEQTKRSLRAAIHEEPNR